MPVIPVKVGIVNSSIFVHTGHLISKTTRAKRAVGAAQVIEHLPYK
jgi:hypothetical protein